MVRARTTVSIAVLLTCIVSCGTVFGLAGDSGQYYFTKSADKVAVVWGDQVTYKYTISNQNATILYDLTVVDDAGTPGDPTDDINVGQLDELRPGQTATLTHTMPLEPMIGQTEQARVRLIAGQHYDAGDVIVNLEDDVLRVVIETKDGWELTETHLYLSVGSTCNPPRKHAPGSFPFSHEDLGGVTTDEYVISVPDIESGDVVTVALHAVVEKEDGSGRYQEETAWGEGEPFPRAWGMYFCLEADPPRREDICITNTAVVTAYAYGRDGVLRLYWSESDTATVCVFLDAALYGISGNVSVDLASIGILSVRPLSGIPVELRKPDGSLVRTVLTGADGNYQFQGVPAGSYQVLVPLRVELSPNFWGYALTPPNQAVSVVDQDATGIDFRYSTVNNNLQYDLD